MIEALAIGLAALMVPAAPLKTITNETYLHFNEPTAYVQQSAAQTGTIYTPNGSPVQVGFNNEYLTESDVEERTNFFTGEGNQSGHYTNLWGQEVTLMNKYIWRKGDPTLTYNSLAFAFYMYWEGGENFENSMHCYINDMNIYTQDHSYVYVNSPQVNDIVLYFGQDSILTAGIVRAVNGYPSDSVTNDSFVKQLSSLTVWSKWHEYGVYEHRGDLCPYIGKYATSAVGILGPTTQVFYLRRHETHSFYAVQGSGNGDKHIEQCSGCGETKTESHSYSYKSVGAIGHREECACGKIKTQLEPHSWIVYHPQPNTGGLDNYVECKFCHYIKKLKPNEIVPVMPYSLDKLKYLMQ